MPVWTFCLVVIVVLSAVGLGFRLYIEPDFNLLYVVIVVFFATNLLVCLWEFALAFRHKTIVQRIAYWKNRSNPENRLAVMEYLFSRIPLRESFSLTYWADIWGAYACIDDSYKNRNTWAYLVDTGNGFVTPLVTVFLYIGYTFQSIPALVTGIVGVAVFWQWAYTAAVYIASFLVGGHCDSVKLRDRIIFIWLINLAWIALAGVGLFISIRLLVDGSYQVLN